LVRKRFIGKSTIFGSLLETDLSIVVQPVDGYFYPTC